jgi:EAL domain-containing protein (putative c-di-GMP-specific phosphodiesterase class I)
VRRDELRNRVMHEVVHRGRCEPSSSATQGCRLIGACLHRQTVQVDDDVFRHREGRDVEVTYTVSPFHTAEGGEGTVVVFKDVSERMAREQSMRRDAEQFAWIGRIQAALAADRFVLHAQPIVDLGSGETVQRQLLLRMREPDGGLVGPNTFLAVAEQTGLIREIDRWVIRRATEIAATGHAVEINLSAHSLGDDSTLEHIENCLRDSAADPALIAFEITETEFVDDMAAARVFAVGLRKLGCRLALDDFGTGYSGFTYLKQIPVDVLKIDMEFVRDVTTNSASRHVIEAVVALARSFGVQTVAEGIEDSETFALLRDLQVDYGQGFHIARPQPFDETTGAIA